MKKFQFYKFKFKSKGRGLQNCENFPNIFRFKNCFFVEMKKIEISSELVQNRDLKVYFSSNIFVSFTI